LDFPNTVKIWRSVYPSYIQLTTGVTVAQVGFKSTLFSIPLWIEGVSASTSINHFQVIATFTPDYAALPVISDTVHLTVGQANLKIDANNDGSITDADDLVEDITGDDAHPGKVILVDNADTDGDGIPDYLDGYNLLPGTTDDNASPGTHFLPMQF